MEISKAQAERTLGVSSTTLYNWANKLDIKFITKVDSKGKSSYLLYEDLKKMATAMGKTLQDEGQEITQEKKENQVQNKTAEESENNEKVQQNFMLQLKVKEQEETIKSNNEIINFYKESNTQLQVNTQEAKTQINSMYGQMLVISNKATTYFIITIGLALLLVLFVVLVVLGFLKF